MPKRKRTTTISKKSLQCPGLPKGWLKVPRDEDSHYIYTSPDGKTKFTNSADAKRYVANQQRRLKRSLSKTKVKIKKTKNITSKTVSKPTKRFVSKPLWTEPEIKKLYAGLKKYAKKNLNGGIDWHKIAKYIGNNRSASACENKIRHNKTKAKTKANSSTMQSKLSKPSKPLKSSSKSSKLSKPSKLSKASTSKSSAGTTTKATTEGVSNPNNFQIGDRIEGNYQNLGHWYVGHITKINVFKKKPWTFNVKYHQDNVVEKKMLHVSLRRIVQHALHVVTDDQDDDSISWIGDFAIVSQSTSISRNQKKKGLMEVVSEKKNNAIELKKRNKDKKKRRKLNSP